MEQPPYWQWIAELRTWLKTSDLTPAERSVILFAATYAAGNGAVMDAGVSELMAVTGYHESVVKRGLRRAIRAGWLERVSTGHRGSVSTYARRYPDAPIGGTGVTPIGAKGGTPSPQRGYGGTPHINTSSAAVGAGARWGADTSARTPLGLAPHTYAPDGACCPLPPQNRIHHHRNGQTPHA